MRKTIVALFILILAACQPETVDYLVPVEEYLVENIGIASFGGQVFCAYEVLDTKKLGNDKIDVYVWTLCQEYYLADGSLDKGTGSSLPVALHLQKADGEYRLLGYEVPKDGMKYGPSIQAIFPQKAIQHMCEDDPACYNGRAERLDLENRQKAREYYSIK